MTSLVQQAEINIDYFTHEKLIFLITHCDFKKDLTSANEGFAKALKSFIQIYEIPPTDLPVFREKLWKAWKEVFYIQKNE